MWLNTKTQNANVVNEGKMKGRGSYTRVRIPRPGRIRERCL